MFKKIQQFIRRIQAKRLLSKIADNAGNFKTINDWLQFDRQYHGLTWSRSITANGVLMYSCWVSLRDVRSTLEYQGEVTPELLTALKDALTFARAAKAVNKWQASASDTEKVLRVIR